MALSIGPNKSALESFSNRKIEKGYNRTGSSQALNGAALRSKNDRPPREINSSRLGPMPTEERRASGILFNASTSLVLKQNTAEQLLATVAALQKKNKEIERETDSTRRAELVEESERIALQAREEYQQASEINPLLAQNETISATLAPTPNPAAVPVTFTTTIPAVSSPTQLGLNQINFSNTQAAQSSLNDVAAGLQNTISYLQSSTSTIATAVHSRTSAIAAQENQVLQVDIDERSTALAEEIAASAQSIVDASPVELLNVESLLASEAVASRRNNSGGDMSDAPPSDADREGVFATEDPVGAGNRLVQN